MNIAILGYGLEGKSSYTYWQKKGHNISIVDENEALDTPSDTSKILGKDAFKKLKNFDLVIRSPILRPDTIQTDGKVWSATNEFFAQCPAPIIGVTGTKGKGTTCSLIVEMLKAAGKTVHLVGNIGIPALDILPLVQAEDVVIFELSSFQLWDLQESPQTAVVLMIEPDHQDVHTSVEEYVQAKAQIAIHQKQDDLIVYHPTNSYSAEIAAQSPALSKKRYQTPEGAYTREGLVVIGNQVVCAVSEIGLLGAHNVDNVCAALTAAWRYTQDYTSMKEAIVSFKGLPHRLEFAGEVQGIRYYNDSQATGSGSTLAALRSFNQPTVLIMGGSDKGVDVTAVLQELDPIRHFVILIGQTSDRLAAALKERNFDAFENLGQATTMSEIVKVATQHVSKDGIVLLSPAHASFGMFTGYQDRGDQFKVAVKKLSETSLQ